MKPPQLDDQGYERKGEAWAPFKRDGLAVMVPCRDCGQETELSPMALEAVRTFSRILKAKGEPILRKDELIFCDTCGRRWKMKQRKMLDAAGDLWAKIKALPVKQMRHAIRDAPGWFRTDQQHEVTKFLAGLNGLSNRKDPGGRRMAID